MESSCPICLTQIPEEKINTLSCGHNICSDCIPKFIEFNNKCPICNKSFMNYISKIDNNVICINLVLSIKRNKLLSHSIDKIF